MKLSAREVAELLSMREFLQLCALVDLYVVNVKKKEAKQVKFDVLSIEREEGGITVLVDIGDEQLKKVRMKDKVKTASVENQ